MSSNDAILALDIGGTKMIASIVTGGEPGSRTVTPLMSVPTPSADADAIEKLVEVAVALAAETTDVNAIALAVAGLVSADRSTVLLAPNMAMHNHDLARRLDERHGLPVFVENDANAAAWGEYLLGVGAHSSVMVMVTIGTGLGGGVVVNGRLLRGGHGTAGEIGHLPFVADGDPCGCGLRGCWEQYVSGRSLERTITSALIDPKNDRVPSALRSLRSDSLTGRDVQAAAQAGDELAVGAFEELGRNLGRGLSSLVMTLDPDVIVVSGGVVDAAALFLPLAQVNLDEVVQGLGVPSPEIRPSALGPSGAIVGVADLAHRHLTAANVGLGARPS